MGEHDADHARVPGLQPANGQAPGGLVRVHPDQDPAAGDLVHRLPDKHPEVRRPEQRPRGVQGRYTQEVEREVGGAEEEGTGELIQSFPYTFPEIVLVTEET